MATNQKTWGPPKKTTPRKSRARPPQGAPVPPAGYFNDFFKNAIDLHKVQGVTPTPYTKTPWQGTYQAPSINVSAFPRYREKVPAPAGGYNAPIPDASGDFISQWRNTEYLRQFDTPGQFRQGNDSVGPGGEMLPNGAQGWDANGNAYYGDGVRGAFSEFFHKIREEPEEATPPSVRLGGENPLEIAGSVVDTVFKNYGNLLNWAKQFRPVRFANESVKLGLSAIGEPAKKLEQAYGVGQGLEKAGEGSPLPALPDAGRFDFLVQNNPAALAYNALRLATSPKPRDEQWRNLEEGYQAGRILWTGAWDPLQREEYIRRWNAGENPYLLARELENPWAEMAGQVVYDPLNAIDFLGFGKARQASKLVSKLDDFGKVAPDILRVIEKGANAANDVEGIQYMNKAVDAVMATKNARLDKLNKLADAHGLFALTSTGRSFVTTQRVGEFLNNAVLFASRTSDEALDMLRGMYLLASDAPEDVTKGLAIIRKSPAAKMFFSDAGMDSAVVLREMIGDSPKAFLNALKKAKVDAKTPEEAIRLVSVEALDKLDSGVKKLFPSLAQRIKAAEEGVEKLGLVNVKKLPWTTRALVSFDNAAQKMIYKPWNTAFATIYMGTSPSYAFRNLFNNVVTAMVDEGIGAAFGNNTRNLAEMKAWLGGALPTGAKMGIVGGMKGVDTAKVPKAFRFATDLAGKMEEWTSVNVAAAATRRLMRKMMVPGRAIPDMRPLLELGMSQDEASALWKLVIKNKGNIRQSVDDFARMAKAGAIDVLETGNWILDALRAPAEDFGVLDDIQQIAATQGKTLDEKLDAMRALRKNEVDKASRVGGEARGMDLLVTDPVTGVERAPEGLDVLESLGGAHNAGDIADDIIQPATDYFNANHNTMSAYRKVLSDWADEMGALLPPKVQKDIRNILSDNPELVQARNLQNQRREVTVAMRDWSLGSKEPPPWWSLDEAWKRLDMPGKAPTDPKVFRQRLWDEYYFRPVREGWNKYREWLSDAVENVVATQPSTDPRILEQARNHRKIAMAYDMMLRNDEVAPQLANAVRTGDLALYARTKAHQYGIASSLSAPGKPGADLDRMLLNIINANLSEGTQAFARLEDVPFEVVDSAIPAHFVKQAGITETVPEAAQVAEQLTMFPTPPVPPAATSQMPSDARMLAEQMEGINKMFDQLEEALTANHGRLVSSNWSKELQKGLDDWARIGEGRMAEARYLVANAADEARKFTLHNYPEKRGFDLALSYIYPYHFWYSRTYTNWMKRIVQHPAVIADYAKYREAMAKAHAGAPDWWKYNINSNELLGIESDHPLFFNLEATLNPLNGLTGVDFNDNEKRINWWTNTVDDLGKFGPSVWTPYQYATALALMMQGEEDAAARWGGRLIPQTLNLKNIMSLMNVNIPTRGGVNEFDPAVQIFSGGQDPYEARRAGRALGTLVDNGKIDQATAIEAARTQDGPVWQMATEEAIRQRAGNPALAITNFMLGVGFKARTVTDMQIDRMDQEWRLLWGLRPNLSPDVFQQKMDALREKYPFMETVILSRKSGDERDEAYAYNVLSRIPPGQKNDAAELVGLSTDKLSEFYESKGAALANWKQPDRDKFMAGIVELGAILDLPDSATRQEWNIAKELYKDVDAAIERQWGDGTLDKIDTYYAFKDDTDSRNNYLEMNPDVQEALEYKDYMMNNNPYLRQYYSSFEKVSKYYTSLMYDDIEKQFGDVWALQVEYRDLQLQDAQAKADFEAAHPDLDTTAKQTKYKNDQLKAAHPELNTTAKLNAYKKAHPNWDGDNSAEEFKNAHPEMDEYYVVRDAYEKRIAEVLTELAKKVKEPVYQFREDVTPETEGEVNLVEGLNQPATPEAYNMSAQDFEAMMSPTLWRLTLDNILAGEPLSRAAEDQLSYLADDLDITSELLLELIGDSLR